MSVAVKAAESISPASREAICDDASDDEVTQALVERARQFPGQEKQVWDFYRQNPQALAEIRAPLFEEKVVDHILGQVKVVDQTVAKEALFGDDESEEAGSAGEAKAAAGE